MAKGNLNGTARSLFELIAFASRGTTLERADAFALGPFPARDDDPTRRLWPGALVELAAEGIGTLRNRLGTTAVAGGRARYFLRLAAFRAAARSAACRFSRSFFLRPRSRASRTLARSPRPMCSPRPQ